MLYIGDALPEYDRTTYVLSSLPRDMSWKDVRTRVSVYNMELQVDDDTWMPLFCDVEVSFTRRAQR